VIGHYFTQFGDLIVTPFKTMSLIWGIVPLYFSWLLNELTSSKANYKTALQTGFSFIWAAAQWAYPACLYLAGRPLKNVTFDYNILFAVNVAITLLVFLLGVVAFISGLRHKFPKYGKFLGHTRFSNYFMIMIFPMQAGAMKWSWSAVIVIAAFAIPLWAILHLVFAPLRK
jgi:hypothetical protein